MPNALQVATPMPISNCACGDTPIVRSSNTPRGDAYWVHCKRCRAGQISRHDSMREAVTTWNEGDRGKARFLPKQGFWDLVSRKDIET
jgi:hypothetical protein